MSAGTSYEKKTTIWTNTKGPPLPCCCAAQRCLKFMRMRNRHKETAQAAGHPGQPGQGNGKNVWHIPRKLLLTLFSRMDRSILEMSNLR